MSKKKRKKLGQFELAELRNPCKTLFANIRFASLDSPIKTIVVTSSVPDEGKSTVSGNLALAIASSGKRVLLMECDMRRRSLGGMMNLHAKYGLYSILSGNVTLSQAIIRTEYPNLYFLDSERSTSNPPGMLSTKRFSLLLEKLGMVFDYVIIDTPPLSTFVDAAIVAAVADGALLCVRQRSTKENVVQRSVQQLKGANANILGLVMTFTDQTENDYYYYYSYYTPDERDSVQETGVTSNEIASSDVDSWAAKVGLEGIGAVSAESADTDNGAAALNPRSDFDAARAASTDYAVATPPMGNRADLRADELGEDEDWFDEFDFDIDTETVAPQQRPLSGTNAADAGTSGLRGDNGFSDGSSGQGTRECEQDRTAGAVRQVEDARAAEPQRVGRARLDEATSRRAAQEDSTDQRVQPKVFESMPTMSSADAVIKQMAAEKAAEAARLEQERQEQEAQEARAHREEAIRQARENRAVRGGQSVGSADTTAQQRRERIESAKAAKQAREERAARAAKERSERTQQVEKEDRRRFRKEPQNGASDQRGDARANSTDDPYAPGGFKRG